MQYRIISFTSKSTKEEIEYLKKWLNLIESNIPVYNTPNHRIEDHIKNTKMVVSFGKSISRQIDSTVEEKKIQNLYHISLPHIKNLTKLSKNSENRAVALKKINEIKEIIKNHLGIKIIKIKEEDLPAITAKELILLEDLTKEKSCFLTSKNGNLIEISTKDSKDSKAHTLLTFKELYIIRQIMDVLQVEEVTIDRSSKNSSI